MYEKMTDRFAKNRIVHNKNVVSRLEKRVYETHKSIQEII